MGWEIGFDSNWDRDIGYGVPCKCDHPDCNKDIDRGLSFVCGNEPYGGDDGCGLFFCEEHQVGFPQLCERCSEKKEPFKPKPDTVEWINWKLTDYSWMKWRNENPEKVKEMKATLTNKTLKRNTSL